MTLAERAEKARKELFARYDQLNALWLKAEERLTKYHVPCPVEYAYATYDPDEPYSDGVERRCLGLQKVKGTWRICYGEYFSCNQPDTNWHPITDCSAEVRVAAAKHLPGLEKAVIKSAERFIPRVDAAIESLTQSLFTDSQMAELLAERAKLNGRPK